MNLPNRLTTARIGLALLMTVFLLTGLPFGKTLALATFAVAGLTDYWDGRLARRQGMLSAFGQLMDPLADKILVGAAFVCFVALDQIVPAWIVIVIISREFMITGLRLLGANKGRVLSAGYWGKHKMIWQIVLIVFVLAGLAVRDEILPLLLLHRVRLEQARQMIQSYFPPLALALAILVAALTLFSGLVYLWQHRDLIREDGA
jgi:CDP-diacylglycerol--glycerol-3-phosphate 3-phosphatidyltransferase